MQLFPPLTDFYNAIKEDTRIGATHISIYMALLQQWNINSGNNPVIINRSTIMKSSKINARQTYNKCMTDLHKYGYIIYKPAANAYAESIVHLITK